MRFAAPARITLLTALLLLPRLVLAHVDPQLTMGSFLGGMIHPVLGLDHFLAMVSVGIISAQIGGRAIWTVPTTFVSVMGIGAMIGWANGTLIPTQTGIAFSVLALGSVIALDKTLPMKVAMGAVAIFAMFHGYAHGQAMPVIPDPQLYFAGFLTGTAGLHITGLIIGDISQHYDLGKKLLRAAGAGTALCGIGFLAGVL
jgi:urease accessory protein